jgi:hypothetical protein
MKFMLVIRPSWIVSAAIANGSPSRVESQPAAPLTRAGRALAAAGPPPSTARARGPRAGGDVLGAAHLDDVPAAPVVVDHDIGIEQPDEAVEVAVACGGHERLDDLPLRGRVAVGGRVDAADAAAPAAGELARRLG